VIPSIRQLQRPEHQWLFSGDVDIGDLPVDDRDDAGAVGLDDVGFVDTGHLHVGAAVVGALDEAPVPTFTRQSRCWSRRGLLDRSIVGEGKRLGEHSPSAVAVQAVGPNPLPGFCLEVVE